MIAAPYADKLPIKVAEYIRQDIPFAILIPLSLLNEIDRVGENQIDEIVRDKRSRMKLIISTSLGQAWLINHPSCGLDTSTHSVFFTETLECEELQLASNAIFSSWYAENLIITHDATFSSETLPSNDLHQLVVSVIDRLMTGGMIQEHDAFADLTPRELRAQKRNSKRQRTVDQSECLDADTAILSDQSMGRSQHSDDETDSPFDRTPFSVEEVTFDSPTATPTQGNECQWTLRHPLHTISTSTPPLHIERWPALQDPEDVPSSMVQVPKEDIKPGMPSDLIILRDKNGRQRILVPRCQRIALTTTEHETMLHVKGTRVLHELSRSYLAEEINALCNAYIVCKRASI